MTDDVDFEIDAEDLVIGRPREVSADSPYSVVVDDLHVTYRVFGGKRLGSAPARKQSLLTRAMRRGRTHVGAISSVHALKGVSFAARRGESIGVVGVNGSGKSTFLRAVAGLVPPTQGRVFVSGEPSLLGVNAVLMADLTGERNIMIGGLALGMTKREVESKFDSIVEFAGIGDFVYLPMKAYSSGMAARLRFAISASATPDILMIDEALATGDATFRNKSQERINEIREHAGTVFLVSHSLATVQAMCSRVLWMHEGHLVMDGPTDEVTAAYKAFTKAPRPVARKPVR